MNFIRLTDHMPDPDQFPRVLIYTEGVDFDGEQFFDVKTEDLDKASFGTSSHQSEVCLCASHWAPRPCDIGEI